MDQNTIISKYEDILNKNSKYTMTGQMNIISNEELYSYDVKVDYLKGDYYKASLTNKETGHEQIILKNKSGVYVVTPNLNKSFKFQSDWPFNSSQAYILSSLLTDLKNDSNVLYEEKDKEYILSSTVNYPNNSNLVSQKIVFSDEILPKKVIVYDKNGNESITFIISKISFDTELDEKYFDVENSQSENCCEVTGNIDEVVYPMYLPVGTKFKSEETIKTDETNRVILTFAGEKPFILIEEVSKSPKEFEITTTSGELVFYENVLGTLGASSLNWTMDGKEYYLIGEDLTREELLKVASSTSVVSLTK